MKKIYTSPELEIVRYTLVDALMASITDSPTTVFDEPTEPEIGGDLDL